MANVSARVDDELKKRADLIAENIGITLSSAIGIFLKRFVAEQGFPFDVKVVNRSVSEMTDQEISELVKLGIKRGKTVPTLPASLYIDPQTNIPNMTKK